MQPHNAVCANRVNSPPKPATQIRASGRSRHRAARPHPRLRRPQARRQLHRQCPRTDRPHSAIRPSIATGAPRRDSRDSQARAKDRKDARARKCKATRGETRPPQSQLVHATARGRRRGRTGTTSRQLRQKHGKGRSQAEHIIPTDRAPGCQPFFGSFADFHGQI